MAGRTPSAWVSGWIGFAAAIMLVTGVTNLVAGIAAVTADEVAVGNQRAVVLLDVTGWGWVHVVLGVVLATVGAALFARATWARYAAVVLVVVNMVTQVMFLPFYPLWSIVVIALEVAVLWALTVAVDDTGNA